MGALQFDEKLLNLAGECERELGDSFSRIRETELITGTRVVSAFIENSVMINHLSGSTGYGYGDIGRDKLDAVFAQSLMAEDALVRHTFVSGTHALTVALFGLLRPGELLLSATGQPYDTLLDVVNPSKGREEGSLCDFGVNFSAIELTDDGKIDLFALSRAVLSKKPAVVYLQRSRGYTLRRSLSVKELGEAAELVHKLSPKTVVMVDNCYGEFVEELEPTAAGADIMAGSLIKNPGGGIARTGGYIAGRRELVERCSRRLTAPGAGREVGCSLDELRNMYLGLFLAPSSVANALRTAAFAAKLFERMGYEVYPRPDEVRHDIIQAVKLGDPELLKKFCEGIQAGSPIDSSAAPEPWDMPGYDCQVIMAAGAFTLGSSIELSADAPMREPYAVWMQGGLTYPAGRAGVLMAAKRIAEYKAEL